MHIRTLLGRAAVSTLLATAVAAPLQAQADVEDYIAYFAMITTPKGALSPLAPANARSALSVRWGRNEVFEADGIDEEEEAVNSFGLTFSPRIGMGRLDLTVATLTCDGCEGNILAEVGFEGTLVSSAMGTGSLSIGLRPAFGYGQATEEGVDGNSMSIVGELPVAFNIGGAGMGRLTLFLTPGFGWGRLEEGDESIDGTRPMLSGGVHFAAASGLGVTAGIQKIFVDEGKATLGLGVSIPLGGR